MTDKPLTVKNAKLFEQEAITPYEKVLARHLVATLQREARLLNVLKAIAEARSPDGDQCKFATQSELRTYAVDALINHDQRYEYSAMRDGICTTPTLV